MNDQIKLLEAQLRRVMRQGELLNSALENARRHRGGSHCNICDAPTRNGYTLCDECATPPCRHGNKPWQCDQCDHEGDIAFDTQRERGR